MIAFIHELERLLEKSLPHDKKAYLSLLQIAKLSPYLTDAAFNGRLILEHLVFVL